jgi:SAM-dependent methyltransferase
MHIHEEFLRCPTHSIADDWYTDFWTELPNEFWRRAVPPEATAAELDFIEAHLGLTSGARILDAPCGSGRHALALAARGCAVTGVDLSPEAIEHARRAAERAGLDVVLTLADMRSVPQDGAFDAALCLGNSFGYLPPAETRRFVAALADAVRPGGGLAIDVGIAAESVLPGWTGEPRTMRTGDITVDAWSTYDVTASRLLSHYTFRRGEQAVTATAVHHLYTTGHLSEVLREGGFDDVRLFAGPDGAPFRVGSPRLILTARKVE